MKNSENQKCIERSCPCRSLQEHDRQIFNLIMENRELRSELDEAISDRMDADRKLTKAYRRNLFQRIVNKRI
jgi:hypothetical protein